MHENRLFEALFDIIPFGVYVADIQTHEIVYMNRYLIDIAGDFRGRVCWQALFQQDGPCTFCKGPRLLNRQGRPNEQTFVFEHFNEVDDHWYQMQEKAVVWPDGRVVKYSIAVDISELKATQNSLAEAHARLAIKSKELERLSVTDSLTGLFNRLRLGEVMEKELYRARRYGSQLSVILLDIDKFKAVNDTHGHHAGDVVLQRTARLLTEAVRQSDIVGRWGGEEYLIICAETDLAGATSLAEKLRLDLAAADMAEVGRVTASFGVASFQTGDDGHALVRRADTGLYRAKENGRNRVEAVEADADADRIAL